MSTLTPHHQLIESALSSALWHVRHSTGRASIQAATGRAIRAVAMLKQACTEATPKAAHKRPATPRQRKTVLLAALQAIAAEVMDYPPTPPISGDSYLPAELVAQALAAIEGVNHGN